MRLPRTLLEKRSGRGGKLRALNAATYYDYKAIEYEVSVGASGGGGSFSFLPPASFGSWNIGGEKRKNVYGNSFHPRTPSRDTLPWGFRPVAPVLDNYDSNPDLANYYDSLLSFDGGLGGSVVEMKITPKNSDLPFFFKMQRKSPDGSNLEQNPPFPSTVNMATWACLNTTIGEKIPLMNRNPHHEYAWLTLIPVFMIVMLILILRFAWKENAKAELYRQPLLCGCYECRLERDREENLRGR